jgi:hypothetical protein
MGTDEYDDDEALPGTQWMVSTCSLLFSSLFASLPFPVIANARRSTLPQTRPMLGLMKLT